jgi:hypothetical protein
VTTRVDPALAPKHPTRWRRAGALGVFAVIAAVTFWVHLYEFNGYTQYDSTLFLAIGKFMHQGLRLYRDLWDTKPPGIFFYQGIVFGVLPVAVWSLRLTDFALYVGAGVLFYWLCRREAGWPLALAGTAVWLYFSHHPSFNIAGFYTEEYAAMFAIAAVAAAARYWQRGGTWPLIACGAAAALAAVFKYPGAACGAPILVLVCARRPLSAILIVAAAGLVPLALVIGYFASHGTLDAFLDCQLWFLDQTPPAFYGGACEHTWNRLGPHPIVPIAAGLGGAICLLRPTRLRLAAAAWLVADLLLIAAQRFYYEHYFIQLFPSATLCGVLGAAWLLQSRPGERRWMARARLALSALAVVLAMAGATERVLRRQRVVGAAWKQLLAGRSAWPQAPGGPFEADIGRYLNQRTGADDSVFIFETGTVVASYWSADRRPASRYIFSLQVLRSPERQKEQVAELERNRPAYVVITGNSVVRHYTPLLEAHYALEAVKWRDSRNRAEIWVRKDHVPPAGG